MISDSLRKFLAGKVHEFIILTDKETELDRHPPHSTDIMITTPFWSAYLTKERISQAPNLKLILTADIGSDHIDLFVTSTRKIVVAEYTCIAY
jgi:formate dehydrogenase